MRTRVINQPEDYSHIMNGWEFKKPVKDSSTKINFAHLFVKTRAELHKFLPELEKQLEPTGMIWVSWLKKSSKIPTDVTEDTIRDFALEIGLVDIKVCAVSDIWSGLKLVIPVAGRV